MWWHEMWWHEMHYMRCNDMRCAEMRWLHEIWLHMIWYDMRCITWDVMLWDALTWDVITWDTMTWDVMIWDALHVVWWYEMHYMRYDDMRYDYMRCDYMRCVSWSVEKVSELFIYNFVGHACSWVSLIACYFDEPLPTPLPVLETVLLCRFRIARSSVCEFSVISWIAWNLLPFKVVFSLGSKKKSAGVRSGE
jgi:hypothetical protein